MNERRRLTVPCCSPTQKPLSCLSPQAWNSAANMLFLDSPAFVGFSYSNSSEDKVVGDARTAADARLFLLGFYKKFPQYADRALYLTGESYAGCARLAPCVAREPSSRRRRFQTLTIFDLDNSVCGNVRHYIPNLAKAIIEGNLREKDPKINLQGAQP